MGHIIAITSQMLPNIGVRPEEVLSPGFQLKDFSFALDLKRGTIDVKAGIEADRGIPSEHCEVQLHKFMVALRAGLREHIEPVLQRFGVEGLDHVFKNNMDILIGGRKLELPEDWIGSA